MSGPERITAYAQWVGKFFHRSFYTPPRSEPDIDFTSTEYIRADLHESLKAENEQLRNAVHILLDCHGTDQRPIEVLQNAEDFARAALKGGKP